MRSAFALLFIFITVQFVAAQEDIPDNPLFPKPRPKRIFVGPMVGYNSNFHSGGFRTLGAAGLSDAECGDFTKGSGNGLLFGLAAEYWFKPGGPTALQLRVYYEAKPGKFTSESSPLPVVDTAKGDIYYFTRTHTVEAVYNLLNVEIQYKYNLPGTRFGVAIGPKFGFLSGSEYYQVQSVPAGFGFPNPADTTQLVNELVLVPRGPIPEVAGFRLGIVAHLQYEVLLGPFLVTPRVLYDLGVTKVSSAASWAVSSLAGTVEIKYGF